MVLLHVVLILLSVPALAAAGYLALLTALSRRTRPPPLASKRLRFAIVVPAHNEEAGVERTVRNLLALEWPTELFRVLVVADNCTDATAQRASEGGATVLVRKDSGKQGKGYALQFAFQHVLTEGWADAAVVVDADTVASPDLLCAFAARLETGAQAIQAEYAVLNCDASWRTRLMALAFALFHNVRSLGRERLGLSCGLRGNGMCFTMHALRSVPHTAFSIVEDVEYGIRLGEASIRVHYAAEARVLSDMLPGAAGSSAQRRRWEAGRMALLRSHGFDLLASALRRRDLVLLDLAADIIVPPLTWVVCYVGLGTIAALCFSVANAVYVPLAPWLVACACIVAYVSRGVWLSRTGLRGLATLAWAPAYMIWKIPVLAFRARERRWVRTARERESRISG